MVKAGLAVYAGLTGVKTPAKPRPTFVRVETHKAQAGDQHPPPSTIFNQPPTGANLGEIMTTTHTTIAAAKAARMAARSPLGANAARYLRSIGP